MEDAEAIFQMLENLQSSDNTIRSAAEQHYGALTPAKKLSVLMSALGRCHSMAAEASNPAIFCLVLLRRELRENFSNVFIDGTSVDEQRRFRLHLIEMLASPLAKQADAAYRNNVCQVLGQIVCGTDKHLRESRSRRPRATAENGEEFAQEIRHCSEALRGACSTEHIIECNIGRECSLRVLIEAPMLMLNREPMSLVEELRAPLVHLLRGGDASESIPAVIQQMAAHAFCSLAIHVCQTTQHRRKQRTRFAERHLAPVVPDLLSVVTSNQCTSGSSNEDAAVVSSLLKEFVQLCDTWPYLLEEHVENLFKALLQVSNY